MIFLGINVTRMCKVCEENFQTLWRTQETNSVKDIKSSYASIRTWYNLIINTDRFSCFLVYFETRQANSKVHIEK